KIFQSLGSRGCLDYSPVQTTKYALQCRQVLDIVINEQDIDLVCFTHTRMGLGTQPPPNSQHAFLDDIEKSRGLRRSRRCIRATRAVCGSLRDGGFNLQNKLFAAAEDNERRPNSRLMFREDAMQRVNVRNHVIAKTGDEVA